MPAFLTRSSFQQFGSRPAQLPFAEFGGNAPTLPSSSTGPIAFQGSSETPQTPQMPSFPFPFDQDELQALLGRKGLGQGFRGSPGLR